MSVEENINEYKSLVQKLYKKLGEHEKYIAYLQGKVAHADKTTLEHRLEVEKCRQVNTVLQTRVKELESENTTLCNQIAHHRNVQAKLGAEVTSRLERAEEKRKRNNRCANERRMKRKRQQAELAQQGIEVHPPEKDPFGFNRLIWSQNNDQREEHHFGPSTISKFKPALLPTPTIPPLFPLPQNFVFSNNLEIVPTKRTRTVTPTLLELIY